VAITPSALRNAGLFVENEKKSMAKDLRGLM
jgi:hypothetical protein